MARMWRPRFQHVRDMYIHICISNIYKFQNVRDMYIDICISIIYIESLLAKTSKIKRSLRMPAPVFFLSSDFSNFWICYTLWDTTKGNLKRNWLFDRFFLLETILNFLKSGHLREKWAPHGAF